MTEQSRTRNSIRNAVFSIGGYAFTMILQLVGRRVFLMVLSNEYLGLGGLFSSILSMLALSELGVGTAMVYALYKPVAENNTEKIKSLMALYKKLYTAIGVFILVVGVLVTPFLQFLIKDMPDIKYIRVYFILYVFNSAFSYFCTYKRSLIICNQKEYISTTTTTIAAMVTRVLQIVVLLVTGNYMLYLIVQIIVTVAENLWISHIANKMYPFIKEKDIVPLDKEDVSSIRKNIGAMFGHKMGDVIVNTTDSLIISRILGLAYVGLFSNYNLILSNIQTISNKIIYSLNASIGNLTASSDKKHSEEILDNIVFLTYCFQCFVTTTLIVILQDFVSLWVGTEHLLENAVVVIFVANLYFATMRAPVMIFRNATGTFWNDRYKPICESVANLVVSIPLTYVMGIGGVKLGTLISTLTVAFWWEAYALYKYYFNKGVMRYLFKQAKFAFITAVCVALTYIVCQLVHTTLIVQLIIKVIICCIVPNVINVLLFYRTSEFKFIQNKVLSIIKRR